MNDWNTVRKIAWGVFAIVDTIVLVMFVVFPWAEEFQGGEGSLFTGIVLFCVALNLLAVWMSAGRALFSQKPIPTMWKVLLVPGLITLALNITPLAIFVVLFFATGGKFSL